MISIDNAVELMLKIYLSLNKRSLGINHKELKNTIEIFPKMLNLIQNYSSDKISLDELDKLEYFHKIRNNLYHQGIGITVVKSVVTKFAVLAQDLFDRLFEIKLEIKIDDFSNKLKEFLEVFRNIEVNLNNFALTENLFPSIIFLNFFQLLNAVFF